MSATASSAGSEGDCAMGWIGLDDTDSLEGGCTTWDMHILLSAIESCVMNVGWRVRGAPQLVRLWPHAPRRTRGNAALAAYIEVEYDSLDEFNELLENWFENRFGHLRGQSQRNDGQDSAPVLIHSINALPEDWYWSAVHGLVDVEERLNELEAIEGTSIWSMTRTDGVVGASSAIAWPACVDWTWEAIAWRREQAIGTQRVVSEEVVEQMAALFSDTILNRDPNAGRSLITPRTPCPVLYGIRSESQEQAADAHAWLQNQSLVERAVACRVHLTNQATGDHLRGVDSGVLIEQVRSGRRGHASARVRTTTGSDVLVAFAEGGPVNRLFRSAEVGDRLNWAGLPSPDGSVHLEQLQLDEVAPRELSRPLCVCGGRLRRKGRGQPLSCRLCNSIDGSHWVGNIGEVSDWVEPPPSHRRHLARPLARRPR